MFETLGGMLYISKVDSTIKNMRAGKSMAKSLLPRFSGALDV
jgi:hypothetical protein